MRAAGVNEAEFRFLTRCTRASSLTDNCISDECRDSLNHEESRYNHLCVEVCSWFCFFCKTWLIDAQRERQIQQHGSHQYLAYVKRRILGKRRIFSSIRTL